MGLHPQLLHPCVCTGFYLLNGTSQFISRGLLDLFSLLFLRWVESPFLSKRPYYLILLVSPTMKQIRFQLAVQQMYRYLVAALQGAQLVPLAYCYKEDISSSLQHPNCIVSVQYTNEEACSSGCKSKYGNKSGRLNQNLIDIQGLIIEHGAKLR